MKLFSRYLFQEIVASILLMMLALLALFAFFDLIQELESLGKGTYGLGQILMFVLLSVPGHVYEVVPVAVAGRKSEVLVDQDEQPPKAQIDKIPTLKPAFRKDGTVTPANSSSISDGAAAVVMMRRSTAEARGLKPLAVIVAHATHAQEPGLFTTAPVGAIRKLYEKTGWTTRDVDLFEINEAFAVVTMAAMKEHEIPHDRVNVHGGACAIGHPIGASGARIVVTLLGALRKQGKKRGVAALCIGGGEATALAVELV